MEEDEKGLYIAGGIIGVGLLVYFTVWDKMIPHQRTFFLGVEILLFTVLYLEREITRDQIFWFYSGLAVFTGLTTVNAAVKDLPSFEYYITFAVLFVLMAALYYPGKEEIYTGEGPPKKKAKKKTKKKQKKAKKN